MFLIVGLGNPGAEYHNTRHNVGFMAVDALASKFSFSSFRSKFEGLIAEGKISGEKCLILKPQTYMNLSGNSVIKMASFYKILPENIIVLHDDMDLDVGRLKAKIGGGAGGHNGLKSIDSHIGQKYNRIRIGVGHPVGGSSKVVGHVLSRFSKADEDVVNQNIETIIDTIDVLIKDGMSAYATKLGMM